MDIIDRLIQAAEEFPRASAREMIAEHLRTMTLQKVYPHGLSKPATVVSSPDGTLWISHDGTVTALPEAPRVTPMFTAEMQAAE